MDALSILLRLIHIFFGVFWAGAMFTMVAFIEPTVRASGPEGGRFMQRLSGQARITTYMSLAALLTALSGIILYWRVSGFRLDWIASPAGLGLTIGSLAGIAAFLLGIAVTGPALRRVGALGAQMQAAGGPPTQAQIAGMQTLQAKIRLYGVYVAVLLAISVIAMAVSPEL